MENKLQSLIHKFQQHGRRLTPQRMEILRILAESRNHPTAEQVHVRVQQRFPMTSLATVYKTITLLKEEGEIHELSFGGESSRYDGLTTQPHPHLICNRCGKILDLDLPLLNTLPDDIGAKYGFKIVNHRVDIFGICPECQPLVDDNSSQAAATFTP